MLDTLGKSQPFKNEELVAQHLFHTTSPVRCSAADTPARTSSHLTCLIISPPPTKAYTKQAFFV